MQSIPDVGACILLSSDPLRKTSYYTQGTVDQHTNIIFYESNRNRIENQSWGRATYVGNHHISFLRAVKCGFWSSFWLKYTLFHL